MATANPFRFSTKFQDDETGLLYYGYRYYDPITGRWNTRDPIGERGGQNVVAFVINEPITKCDYLGLVQPPGGGPYPFFPPYPKPPPEPLGTNQVGFEMCRRDIIETSWLDRLGNDCCAGLHMFVRQKFFDEKGSPVYRGWGFDKSGPHLEADAVGKFPPTCVACKKTSTLMKYGKVRKSANEATDDEVWDCLQSVPKERGYSTLNYNCGHYAREAARACGLDCPQVPSPATRSKD
jgi:RHS repeat-associated protein